MFTNTRVLQWNHHTNYAVFIFENLLEKEQLDIVLNKTLELTKQDTKKRKGRKKGQQHVPTGKKFSQK